MVDVKKRNSRQYHWQKENTDRLNFVMPKGMKDKIKEAAESLEISSAEFVRQAIQEKMENIPKM